MSREARPPGWSVQRRIVDHLLHLIDYLRPKAVQTASNHLLNLQTLSQAWFKMGLSLEIVLSRLRSFPVMPVVHLTGNTNRLCLPVSRANLWESCQQLQHRLDSCPPWSRDGLCLGENHDRLQDQHHHESSNSNMPTICKHAMPWSLWDLLPFCESLWQHAFVSDDGTLHAPSLFWTSALSWYCRGAKVRSSLNHLALCFGSILPLRRFGGGRPPSCGEGVVKHGMRALWLHTSSENHWRGMSMSQGFWNGKSQWIWWCLSFLDHLSGSPVTGLNLNLGWTKDTWSSDWQAPKRGYSTGVRHSGRPGHPTHSITHSRMGFAPRMKTASSRSWMRRSFSCPVSKAWVQLPWSWRSSRQA